MFCEYSAAEKRVTVNYDCIKNMTNGKQASALFSYCYICYSVITMSNRRSCRIVTVHSV